MEQPCPARAALWTLPLPRRSSVGIQEASFLSALATQETNSAHLHFPGAGVALLSSCSVWSPSFKIVRVSTAPLCCLF